MDEIDYLVEQDLPYNDEISGGDSFPEDSLEEPDSIYGPMTGVAGTTTMVAAGMYRAGSQQVIGNLSGEGLALFLGGGAALAAGIAISDYLER